MDRVGSGVAKTDCLVHGWKAGGVRPSVPPVYSICLPI